MADTNVTGNLIVKGNVYFLGYCLADSAGCNFDPLRPDQLLAVKRYTLPSSAVNIISNAAHGSPNAQLAIMAMPDDRYNISADDISPSYSVLSADALYCTGKIYALYPKRTLDGQTDTRQPAQGFISERYIEGITQRDADLPS